MYTDTTPDIPEFETDEGSDSSPVITLAQSDTDGAIVAQPLAQQLAQGEPMVLAQVGTGDASVAQSVPECATDCATVRATPRLPPIPAIALEGTLDEDSTGEDTESDVAVKPPPVDKAAVAQRLEELTKQFETPIRSGRSERVSLGQGSPQHYTAGDLKKAAEQTINWQIENLWTMNAKLLLASEPKAGKTFFVMSIAAAMASGQMLWDTFKVTEPGPVGIIAAEDDQSETGRRLDRMCRAQGLMMSNLPIHWWPGDAIRLNRPRDVDWLRKMIRQYELKLIIYDPLARLMDGDENNKECVSGVLTPASSITRPENEGCSVMIVHHLGKDNPDQPKTAAQRVRGSSDIRSWYTTGMFLSGALGNGRVGVELEQRVSGKCPGDFPVKAVEVEEESVYGLGTLRLVANIAQRRTGDDASGNNQQLVDTAAQRILDLVVRKAMLGVTMSEISIHLQLGKAMEDAEAAVREREKRLYKWEGKTKRAREEQSPANDSQAALPMGAAAPPAEPSDAAVIDDDLANEGFDPSLFDN